MSNSWSQRLNSNTQKPTKFVLLASTEKSQCFLNVSIRKNRRKLVAVWAWARKLTFTQFNIQQNHSVRWFMSLLIRQNAYYLHRFSFLRVLIVDASWLISGFGCHLGLARLGKAKLFPYFEWKVAYFPQLLAFWQVSRWHKESCSLYSACRQIALDVYLVYDTQKR